VNINNNNRLEDLQNLTDNQKAIFKCILNMPRTKEEISSALNLSEKTVSNNIPLMARQLEYHDVVRYVDSDGNVLYSIKEQKVWHQTLLPKVYKYNVSPIHPYMVINLPDPPEGNHWTLYPFGDLHYGASECDYLAVDKALNLIDGDANGIVILMGDLMENANKESPADSVYRQVIQPQQQQEDITNKLSKIAHKIIASVGGNHGDRSIKAVYLDPDKSIADSIEVEHFPGMLYLDIICQNYKWEILVHHGDTSSTTLSGRINAVKKKNIFHTADIFLMGHTHDTQFPWDIEIKRDPRNMKLAERDRSYILTGGFLKPHIGYPNKKGYPPLPICMPSINLLCDGSSRPGSHIVINGRDVFYSS